MRRKRPGQARALALLAAVGLASCGLAGCGGESAASVRESHREQATRKDPGRWLNVDAAAKTATITLELGYDKVAAGFNIDGAVKGGLLFAVPSGWRVRVHCVNHEGERRFSCVLARAPGVPIVDPAIVDVLHPTLGLTEGSSFTFSFDTHKPTRYRLVAVSKRRVPAGMWVVLKVAPGGSPYVRWLR